jgi:DNA ligase-1
MSVRREAANRVDVDCWYAQGVMLAKPDKLCSGGRSDNLLKVKSAQTTEALVVGHQAGKGKNVGVMGALECKLRSGKKFKVRPACPRSRASMSSLPARQRLSHGVFHCVSLAVSPTVSPSPSLPLCLSHCELGGTQIGTGFTDKQRADPPPVGSVVEFKYFELTRDEVPRFPAYQRIRPDVGADQFTKGK